MDRYANVQNTGSADSLFPYLNDSVGSRSTSDGSRDTYSVSGKDRHTIGEVVSLLQDEFPSLSVSKVRYLERRELLTLERTSGGYRLFSYEDIQLLRRILALQDTEYLPLEVIKDRIDRGIIQNTEDSPEGYFSAFEFGNGEEEGGYTKEDIVEELEADSRFIEELLEVGVIGRGSGGVNPMSRRDLEVARIATEMSKYSIQPRHLRGIVASVDREVAMFKQVLNPDLRSGDDQRVGEAMKKARHLASVDSQLKELIMAEAIESLDRSGST